MINNRYQQPFPRVSLAAMAMRGRTCAARGMVASSIGNALVGLAMWVSDPSGGPDM